MDMNPNFDLSLTLPKDCKLILQKGGLDNKIAIFARFWTVADCKESPKSLFVFGDNDVCKGIGGQAIIRNCPNSIGIPTKHYPNNQKSSFYTDATYDANCLKIYNAIVKIIRESSKYDEIVFPESGFGTGLAKLPEFAPKTLAYLDKLIDDVFGIDYETIRKDGGFEISVMPSKDLCDTEIQQNHKLQEYVDDVSNSDLLAYF